MNDDSTLLQDFANNRSEAAFAELVRRHVNFVYAAALRQVQGDRGLAQDVVQGVFLDLARKARAVSRHPVLAGWLFTSTRYAAAKAVRAESRRRIREQEAQRMQENIPAGGDAADWTQLRPWLDTALNELNARDRHAILLRYFQGCDYTAVGERLDLSENAARMCVDRAMEKLRSRLAKRGVTSTAAALTIAFAGQAAVAAPFELAGSVTTAVLAKAAAGGGLLAALGVVKVQWFAAGTIVLGGIGAGLVQQAAQGSLLAEIAARPVAPSAVELAAARGENRRLASTLIQADVPVSDAEWARLRTEVTALQDQIEQDTRQARAVAAASRERALREALPLGQLDQAPRPAVGIPPRYPAALREAKVAGSVVVEFVIDRDGLVADAKVVRSTHQDFEAPTLAALKQWKFAPGTKGGRPVATRATQMFQYQPSDGPPPVPAAWF